MEFNITLSNGPVSENVAPHPPNQTTVPIDSTYSRILVTIRIPSANCCLDDGSRFVERQERKKIETVLEKETFWGRPPGRLALDDYIRSLIASFRLLSARPSGDW